MNESRSSTSNLTDTHALRKVTSSSLLRLVVASSIAIAFPSYSQEETPPADPPADPPATGKTDPTLEQYYVANGAYNRKLYPVAIQQYQAFLEAHPDHAKADLARRGLALSHYASKQYKEAIAPLSSLLGKEKLDPSISRERLVMMHGQCLLITGEKDKAKTLYASEIENLKTPAYIHAALASISDVSFGAGQWNEVITWTGRLLDAQPGKAQAARGYYQQGYAHYQLKDPEKAIAALSKIEALEAEPVWITRGLYLTGECYNQLKESQKAMEAFQKALPGLRGQDAIECRYRLGLTHFVLKDYEASASDLTAYLEAAADGSHAPEARLYLARTHLERGSFETAGTQLKALAEGASKVAPRASLWHARVYTRPETKDYTSAASVLATATETYAESPIINDLRFDYANALMAKPEPDWENALAALSLLSAAQDFGQQAEVLNQTAVCQQKLRKYEESLASNNKFLGEHAEHQLAGEARFMKAENLFLLDRLGKSGDIGGTLINMAVFGAVLSYAMVMFSYIRLRLTRPELERPYRSPLGIPGAAIGGALSILALAATVLNKDYQLAIIWVAGFLAVGIGYYLLYSRHKLVAQAPEEEVALLARQLGELDGKDGAD